MYDKRIQGLAKVNLITEIGYRLADTKEDNGYKVEDSEENQ
jgi:hypothetical protein